MKTNLNSNIIRVNSPHTNITYSAFQDFMRLAEKEFNTRAKAQPGLYKSCKGKQLEQVTVDLLRDICPQTPFMPQNIQLVSGQQFPDIIASNAYGVEVKSTEKNQWTSTGSSIVESTRIAGVKRIYMLFGNLGSNPETFQCKPYEDVLYDVAVTHSPRYLIDMNLNPNDSIFRKMGTTYDNLRTSQDAVNQVRQYYIRKASLNNKKSMPWWLESDTQMSIQLWSSLSKKEKEILQSKMCILFSDDILSNKKEKYARVSLWLCAKYSILVYNARDCFSAGGQCSKVNGKELGYKVPQVVARYVEHAETIKKLLGSPLEIKEEIQEFNPGIWDKNKEIYKNWLDQTSDFINRYVGRTVPFREWFEKEMVIS